MRACACIYVRVPVCVGGRGGVRGVYVCVCVGVCVFACLCVHVNIEIYYGVATISRLLKNIGLF